MRQTDVLKILNSSDRFTKTVSSRRCEMKTMADPQHKCTVDERE